VATPENLATLKAQLQQALAQVEGQERAMEESQKPQTVEEAEALEQKLVEALEDLRQHRDELRRRSAGEGQ
jgi:acyl-CoA thioesterase